MAEFASSFIRKRRNRFSASSEGEKSVSPEAKKLKDFEVTSNDKSDCDQKDEVMEAVDKIGAIGEGYYYSRQAEQTGRHRNIHKKH